MRKTNKKERLIHMRKPRSKEETLTKKRQKNITCIWKD